MVGNVNPKKFLGQHFLTDDNISKKIIESIDFNKYDKVIEVGPGKGALTKYLLDIKNKLTIVEIDKESIQFLQNEFKEDKIEIIEEDFLKFDIPSHYPSIKNILIIGNFPYNISSQILFKTFENKDRIDELVGMFQKEVAERIACVNGKKRGILSVLIQTFYNVEYCFSVDEIEFSPKPKVKSGVIKITATNASKDPLC